MGKVITAICWVFCSCGRKHKLHPGLTAPVYWCGSELKELQPGDTAEIIEEAD